MLCDQNCIYGDKQTRRQTETQTDRNADRRIKTKILSYYIFLLQTLIIGGPKVFVPKKDRRYYLYNLSHYYDMIIIIRM